jgi:hypothetical protein
LRKTEALRNHAYRPRADKIAAGEGEVHVGPVESRFVTAQPVQTENDWVANRHNTESDNFRMRVD